MRLFPAVDMRARNFLTVFFLAGLLLAGMISSAMAEDAAPPVAAAEKPIDRESFFKGMQAAQTALQGRGLDGSSLSINPDGLPKKVEERDLGSINDPNSPLYKADRLARQARKQRESMAVLGVAPAEGDMIEPLPPPEMETLQQIKQSRGGTGGDLSDDDISKEISLDMRKDAQREAALSYGARGGLAKRNYQIMERMKGFDQVLDRVFDFRSLLIKTASGLLIEPPIVKESIDALLIADNGDEAAVADKVFDINKKAKIVSAPRDWRQYLVQSWTEVPPPPRVLWPKNAKEQSDWNTWIGQGWDAGFEQAEQMFESNVNKLVADYNGMVRYKMLLAQGMISAPYAMHEDRGVTGNKNQMRVGDRALRITGPSQFLTGAELWKPADR